MVEPTSPSLVRQMIAEFIGTFLLIFFGLGAVHAAVLTGAQAGLWQVAIVWGIAIMLAIYTIGGISGAHINPAITIAFALWRKFCWKKVFPYIVAQLAGSIAAALLLLWMFGSYLTLKEEEKQVQRGTAGSIVTAMCYGEYFPNPGDLAAAAGPYSETEHNRRKELVTPRIAFGAELIGTLILAFVVFAVSDHSNSERPTQGMAPVFIGLTVAALISVIAPLTQACFNPARDFGPRLLAYYAGWREVAFPGIADLNWLTVYIIAPIVGAALGGALYEFVVRPGHFQNPT